MGSMKWLYVPIVVLPVIAAAQETIGGEGAVSVRKKTNRLMEEVVVTAQKREQAVQDVPIAISAFTPEKLDAMGVESVQDLEVVTPGLTITTSAGFGVAYLRGIGTEAFLPGADSSVPFYLDGIALQSTQGSVDTLGRVERVEVLKGPQGTLFGRNATGGAVSIITPNPSTEEFFGDVTAEFAEYSSQKFNVFLNIPLTDNAAFTLSAYDNQQDNYYDNINPSGDSVLDIYSKGYRVKGYWGITENIDFSTWYSYSEGASNAGLTWENTRPHPRVGDVSVLPADPKADRKINTNQRNGVIYEAEILSGTLAWSMPWFDARVILSDQAVDAPFTQADFDGTNLPMAKIATIKQVSEQQTQEIQFLSNEGSPWSANFNWVAGFYFLQSSGGFDPLALTIAPLNLSPQILAGLLPVLTDVLPQELLNLGIPDLVRVHTGGVLVSDSKSVYAQGSYSFADAWELTIGARYQLEDRDLEDGRLALDDGMGNEGLLIRSDEVPLLEAEQFAPKVALSWRPFQDDYSQIYASYSRAFKSPTYNTVNFFDTPESVDEEIVDSFEIGIKTEIFDGNMKLNGAAFYTEQENLLTAFISVNSGGIVSYYNAGNSKVSGVEGDFLWTPFPNWNPGLVLTGSATYLNTEYTEFRSGNGYDDNTGLAYGPGTLSGLPGEDFSGNEIPRSPEWTATFGFNQAFDFGDHSIEVGADTYYNSGFFFSPQNSEFQAREEYYLLNARVSYFYLPWDLQLTVFGQNITDETYNEHLYIGDFGVNQILNDPAILGGKVKWSF